MMEWTWPQIVMLGLFALNIVGGLFPPKEPPSDWRIPIRIADTVIWAFVLGWGGFWK